MCELVVEQAILASESVEAIKVKGLNGLDLILFVIITRPEVSIFLNISDCGGIQARDFVDVNRWV